MADADFAGTDRAESRDVSRIFGKHQGSGSGYRGYLNIYRTECVSAFGKLSAQTGARESLGVL
jgi:hypothetical protein